jgi:hypothetical protein
MIILKLILNKCVVRCGLVSPDTVYDPVACSFGHGDEPSGSMNNWRFVDHLSDYHLLKKALLPELKECMVV